MTLTSYEVQWTASFRPRPDYDLSPREVLFTSPEGRALFTVRTVGGIPSDGILALIKEAPRLRDELDAALVPPRDRRPSTRPRRRRYRCPKCFAERLFDQIDFDYYDGRCWRCWVSLEAA